MKEARVVVNKTKHAIKFRKLGIDYVIKPGDKMILPLNLAKEIAGEGVKILTLDEFEMMVIKNILKMTKTNLLSLAGSIGLKLNEQMSKREILEAIIKRLENAEGKAT